MKAIIKEPIVFQTTQQWIQSLTEFALICQDFALCENEEQLRQVVKDRKYPNFRIGFW
jgi:hypothetical protein